ncbi:MAG: hypothetical protein AAB542_03070 [Patescibacteria group bacterium]
MVDHIRPITASVVGLATDITWGQVLQTPHAYGVVEIYAADGIARVRGVQVLTKLTSAFDTPPVSLSALSGVADAIMSDDIVSLVLLVPVGTTLYLVSRGAGRVYLKREHQLAQLLDGEQALSGDVRLNDIVIAATSGFIRVLTQEEIIGVFDHLAPAEVAEKLTIRLHEHPGGEGGAALIFQVNAALQNTQEDVSLETAEEILSSSRVRTTIVLSRVKAIGRKMMTVRQRASVRRLVLRMRASRVFSPRHIGIYTILVLFVLSVLLGIRRQMTMSAQTKYFETLVAAQHSFDEGMALLDLNPVKGRERLTAARDLLTPVISKKLHNEEARKAQGLYDEVTENLTRAMRVTRVTPELYFDMSLLKNGAAATDISLFENTIGVVDAVGKTVYTVGMPSKNGSIVGGGESFAGGLHIAAYGDKLYVWTPQGIHQIRLSDQKTVPAIIPPSPEWGTITDMAAFGGNIYLLDTVKSRIWKYVATEKGFSPLFEYLNPDTLPDLSHTTNVAIDGSVWLGTNTGKILRFTSGKENSYSPQGADMPMGSQLKMYTHDEAKMVYVLDSEHKRVVVYDKDGLYISQYIWDKTFVVTGLVVSESLGKLLLLADGKIYSIDLK